jgi:hypothetical protein
VKAQNVKTVYHILVSMAQTIGVAFNMGFDTVSLHPYRDHLRGVIALVRERDVGLNLREHKGGVVRQLGLQPGDYTRPLLSST